MIFLAQIIYVIADGMGLSLALGWNKLLGLPTKAGYLMASVVSVLDGGFNQFAALVFFGKVKADCVLILRNFLIRGHFWISFRFS